MVKNITQAYLAKIQPSPSPYDVRDSKQRGLVLRVRPTGEHSYLVRIALGGRRRWHTLGKASLLTPAQAREMAQGVLSDLARGIEPGHQKSKALTFGEFLDKQYEPWAEAHLKSADTFVGRIRKQFMPLFGHLAVHEISSFAVQRWRTARLKGPKSVTAATVNRDLVALKACLSKAVEWGATPLHPIRDVKRSKEDNRGGVRYLSDREEQGLRLALATRDDVRRADRATANVWRVERGYAVLPDHGPYTDHLTPIVVLALNTGLRRGELFNLRWSDVDFVSMLLTVRGSHAKSGRTRHVPLNAEAVAVLRAWHGSEGLVFPGEGGGRLVTLKTAWGNIAKRAGLDNFRFHDLRHTFASKLVQRGVDLNTVRELLGHSDFALTLRYAHLAAETKAAAVARLMVHS